MDKWTASSTFNRQRTMEPRTVDGKEVEVVTEIVIETALPLVLTQDVGKAHEPNHQVVPESADLKVFGDEVTISGTLSMPGRTVHIFARTLHARSDGITGPAIIVDGPELPAKQAKPQALPKGASPAANPTKGKVRKGKKGEDGYNERVQPTPLASERMEPGRAGWSSWDHPTEMNGEPGTDGAKGLPGGAIFVLCSDTRFGAELSLSAIGGPGGDGQPGQDGADGGDGGRGFDAKVESPLIATYRMSTAGGNGGMGGIGGTGGRGGTGGDGGTILFHCLSTAPSVASACDGGTGGAAGIGGRGGLQGLGGVGGKSAPMGMSLGPSREIPGSPDGKDGLPAPPWGGTGQNAPASQPGSASVTAGAVASDTLAQLASVSQLQMLFERTRAEYLVTEPVQFDLRLQSVLRTKDVVRAGRNLIVVAAVGTRLHIRVFDQHGKIIVDTSESGLPDRERVAALKDTVRALGLNFAPAIEMTPRGALLAGDWVTDTDPEPPSGWRGALISRLNASANTSGRADYYTTLNDRTLTTMIAVIGFLLRTGLRDQRTLRGMTPRQQQFELVDALQILSRDPHHSGPSADELGSGIATERLLEIGVEWTDTFRRDETVPDISEKDQRLVIEQVAHLWADANWSRWYRMRERLGWVVGILNKIPEKHPQKALADTICLTAWSAQTNHNNGLDYYGKTPRFAPILSLDTYLTALDGSLRPLKDIEKKTKLYFDAIRADRDATNDLQAALNQTDKALALLNVRKENFRKELSETTGTINKLDSEQNALKQDLKQELETFKDEVKAAFGLTPDTFFNCLFQLSFINVHEPANALDTGAGLGLAGKMGLAQAGAMGASQLGLMIKEANENVINGFGERINKKLLLDQVETIAAGADLNAEFAKREDGILSTEGSARLLVDLAQFREVCKQFYGLGNARTIREDLDGYIDTITKRNRHIDYYNLLLVGLVDLTGEIGRLTLQQSAVQGAIADNAKPGLPAMATFVSGLYERSKAVCVSDFYDAYRAYAFWALQPYSGFYDKIGRTPGAINFDQLSAAQSELKNDVLKALGNNYRTPNHFPASEENESSIGRVVVLTKKTHPDFFADLRSSREAEFELEPATKSSVVPKSSFAPTDAAWCYERPEFTAAARNPFAGMADVRLTKVRVWLVGKANTLDHKVILTHLGSEQFRTPDDKPYPERVDPAEKDQDERTPEYIFHEPVSIPFNYNAKGLRYDERTSAFTPGQLFHGVVGSQDGDLGFPKSGISDLPAAGKYAPIGPFGRWRVEVPENLNPSLKLADLHAVVIDFHGFHQAYKSGS